MMDAYFKNLSFRLINRNTDRVVFPKALTIPDQCSLSILSEIIRRQEVL